MMDAIDAYHGNSQSAVKAAMAQSAAVVAKASENLSKDVVKNVGDSSHDWTVALARATGKLVGHYHYGWFGGDPIAQAKFFVSVANAQPGDTMWLDVERSKNATVAQWPASAAERLAFTLAFSATVTGLTGAKCGHYCNRTDWSLLKSAGSPSQKSALLALPLWIADPSSPDGHPAISDPWFMQQTAIVNNIDRDLINGDANAWASIGVPGADMALTQDDINNVAHAVWNTTYPDPVLAGSPASSTASLLLRARIDANKAAQPAPAPAPAPTPVPATPVALAPADIDAIANKVADLLAQRLTS